MIQRSPLFGASVLPLCIILAIISPDHHYESMLSHRDSEELVLRSKMINLGKANYCIGLY